MTGEPPIFQGRAGLQQRVLPNYRLPFVDLLARACTGGLEVFAGVPAAEEAIVSAEAPLAARWVRCRNMGGPGRWALLIQFGLAEWLARWQPEALILEANPRHILNWRAAVLARRNGTRVIGWGLGAPNAREAGGAKEWLWRRFLQQFDALIAYSSRGASEYETLGVQADSVFVAYNAVTTPPAPQLDRSVARDRRLRLLFVGRLQPRKRIDLLLRASSRLDPPAEIRIVGDGPFRPDLERMAAGIEPAPQFDGTLDGSRLRQAFEWADLFVLPGTGGLALQQAMAHGLPLVAAVGDGTQDDLVRPVNGWLVTPGSLESLVGALQGAQADPEALLEMGRASRRIAEDEINIARMVEVFVRAMTGQSSQDGK